MTKFNTLPQYTWVPDKDRIFPLTVPTSLLSAANQNWSFRINIPRVRVEEKTYCGALMGSHWCLGQHKSRNVWTPIPHQFRPFFSLSFFLETWKHRIPQNLKIIVRWDTFQKARPLVIPKMYLSFKKTLGCVIFRVFLFQQKGWMTGLWCQLISSSLKWQCALRQIQKSSFSLYIAQC